MSVSTVKLRNTHLKLVAERPPNHKKTGESRIRSRNETPAVEESEGRHEKTPEQREQSYESEDEIEPRNSKPSIPIRIPKPKGEVGHPNNGGYSLQAALGWEKVQYDTLRVSGQHLSKRATSH